MKLFILLIVWSTAVVTAHAQHFQYKYYTEKDGLSNHSVSSLLTDAEGFLWVGTSSGLNRFDGNEFEKFTNDPADSNSIADDNIQKLFSDRHHNIWIGTNAGISLYHPSTHEFSNYSPDTTLLPQPGISFQAICDDNDGNLWVGARNDLLLFDPVYKKFTSSGWAAYATKHAPVDGNYARIIILSIIKKNKEDLWVLSTYGLYSVNTITRQFTYYPYSEISDYHGCELNYADDKGNVWISTYYAGVLCFNSIQGTWTVYHTPQIISSWDNSYCILPYSGDSLMYCCSNKVVILDTKQKKWSSLIDDNQEIGNFLLHANCRTITRYNNLLLIGTDKGLIKMTPSNSLFRFINLPVNETILRVFQPYDSNELLFNSYPGHFTKWLDKKTNSIRTIIVPEGPLQSTYQYFAEASDGSCYLNSDDHFYTYNIATHKATSVELPPKLNPLDSFSFRNMVIDRDGNVWIRTLEQGILEYDKARNQLSSLRDIPYNPERQLNTLYYDSASHTIWVAEEFNGIYVYDIAKKEVQHFNLNQPSSKRNAAIINITGDGKGIIWLCNVQSGLIEYNAVTKKFTRYTVHDGLPSNNCVYAVYDGKSTYWFSTDIGLCKYDSRSKTFTGYTENEGFPVVPEAYLSADRKGNIYMPYKNGYYTWNGEASKDPLKKDFLYLRDILLSGAPVHSDTSYHFSYKENNIRLLFGLLSFDDRDRILIEYSLNGGAWFSTDIRSYISFVDLAPGSYDLQVRVKNDLAPGMHIVFIIAKPFWQEAWFIAIVIVFFIISVFLATKNRLNSIRRSSSLRQKAMESEMSALRSQMNPHFIFNTLNSINSYIIDNKQEEASDYLTDFSKLMRVILEHSRKKTVTLQEELNALKLYLELEWRRLEASFDYKITISPEIDPASTNIPPLIIQPYVENAIWHGLRSKKSEGHINIRVSHYEEGICVIVEDNGVGRTASHKTEKVKSSHSFGTAATMQRILLNDPKSKIEIEDLYDANGQPGGTRVSIYLNQNII